jgi:hypothetical protein
MRYFAAIYILIICGCIHDRVSLKVEDTNLIRTAEYQKEIAAIIAEDTENKEWERTYLKEIAIAQENNDQEGYKFFIIEYIKLPRLVLPEWMKNEPGYTKPVSEADVLRGQIRIILKHE